MSHIVYIILGIVAVVAVIAIGFFIRLAISAERSL